MDADFFKYEEKKPSVFENSRLRVDGQIRFKNATCGRRFFLKAEEKSPLSKILNGNYVFPKGCTNHKKIYDKPCIGI